MKKDKSKAKAKPETEAAASAGPVSVLQVVKKDAKYRGAREAWYLLLQKHDGKPAADFLADAKANPPALPKSGVAEDPRGWLGYFRREGIVNLVEG